MAKASSSGNGSGNASAQGGPTASDSRPASVREPGNTPDANSVRPSATPAREASTDDAPRSRRRLAQSAREHAAPTNEPRLRAGAPAQPASENAVRPTPRPVRDVAQEAAASKARTHATAQSKARAVPSTPSDAIDPETKIDRHTIPEDVKRRFVRVGNKYHFPDGAQAFTDHGNRLTSASENIEVIKSLISIAQARGWSDITITGTERFRKEAWFAGRLAGLDVRGYAPTEFEQERLVRALARAEEPPPREVAASPSKPSGDAKSAGNQRTEPRAADGRDDVQTEVRERHRTLQVGRLVDHGAAPFQHDPHNAMSYFVKLETDAGERVIWGVDLHRALKESLTRPQIGDEIGLRTIRRETVTVWEPQHDAEGRVIGEKKLETHRNAWVVEKRDFFRERAQASRVLRDANIDQQQAVSRHPELIGTYLQLHAAEIAAKNIRDPQDQKQFVASVRTALADSVARGEPLTPVRLKETTTPRREARAPSSPASSEREPPARAAAREPAPVRG